MKDRRDWIFPSKPVCVLVDSHFLSQGVCQGLLWGEGEPALFGSNSYHWAVVEVRSYCEGVASVTFGEYDIVFEGDRAGAVRTLIERGADPARISVQTDVKGSGGVAKTGSYGASIAGPHGIARTNERGVAKAGDHGLAWAGEDGWAEAGDNGVAIISGSGLFGEAQAGREAIAIALGSGKKVSAGAGGIAIAAGEGEALVADKGIAIGRRASGSSHSIVIGEEVFGGEGSLLVSRRPDPESGSDHVACGLVGQNGIKPYVTYIAKDGVLIEAEGETTHA